MNVSRRLVHLASHGLLGRRCALAVLLLLPVTAAADQLRPINIGLSTSSLVVASARIANAMGLFAKHGLNPRFTMMDNGNEAVSAMIGGSFDAVIATSSDIVAARARGQDLIVVDSVYSGLGATVILAKSVADKLGVSASAPAAERLKALQGLMIAVPSPTAGYAVTLRSALRSAGVTARYTYSAAAAMPPALATGAVQAYITSAPFWTPSIVSGTGLVWLSGPRGEFPDESSPVSSASLQMTRKFADANKAVVDGLVGTLGDFSRALDETPGAVKVAIRTVFPNLDDQAIDIFLTYESRGWKARRLTPADMAHEVELVKASGANIPGLDALDPAAFIAR